MPAEPGTADQATVFDDVALFNTIDKLLREHEESCTSSERRGSDRHAYRCVQLLAPYGGGRLPGPAEFCQVQCQDISGTGFSFVSRQRPDTKHVVVALGQIPFLFVVAEVRHARLISGDRGDEFLVGCRFTKRLTGKTTAGGEGD